MFLKTLFALALALSVLPSRADTSEGGLINGDKWAILVSAPEGWVWDKATLRSQGIWGLYYKAGSSYSPAKLHIYISPTAKKEGKPVSLDEFMEADKASFMSFDPDLHVKVLPPYSPGMEYNFAMRELDDADNGYYQTLAYYEGEKAFFVIVLSCRSPLERETERRALLELLDSFTYMRKE
jgi:hypothetical protein